MHVPRRMHHLHGHSPHLIPVLHPSLHAALLQVLRQPAYRLVNRPQPRPVRLVNIVMRIPAHRDHLYKPNAAFHKPPPQLVGILIRPPIPIHRQRPRLLLRQVDHFRHLCVHPKSQFIALPPRDQRLMLWMPLPVQFVQLLPKAETGLRAWPRHPQAAVPYRAPALRPAAMACLGSKSAKTHSTSLPPRPANTPHPAAP